MKVFEINQDPSVEDIARMLKHEFSDNNSYSYFGIGENKSVVVRKSEFVGAQISRSGNRITVYAMSPNLLLSSIDILLSGLIGAVNYSSLIKLEKDLVIFLKSKYSI